MFVEQFLQQPVSLVQGVFVDPQVAPPQQQEPFTTKPQQEESLITKLKEMFFHLHEEGFLIVTSIISGAISSYVIYLAASNKWLLIDKVP